MKALEKYTNEKTKLFRHRQESRAEFATLLHCGMGQKWPKVIRTPTLIYLATVQQQPLDNKHSKAMQKLIRIL